MNKNNNQFASELFLKEIEDKQFRLELTQKIYEIYCKRIDLKLSQTEVADLCNLSLSSVKRIEKGECYDTRLIAKYTLCSY